MVSATKQHQARTGQYSNNARTALGRSLQRFISAAFRERFRLFARLDHENHHRVTGDIDSGRCQCQRTGHAMWQRQQIVQRGPRQPASDAPERRPGKPGCSEASGQAAKTAGLSAGKCPETIQIICRQHDSLCQGLFTLPVPAIAGHALLTHTVHLPDQFFAALGKRVTAALVRINDDDHLA
nr:hypothetical protein [Tanacetum cinerariifolium]